MRKEIDTVLLSLVSEEPQKPAKIFVWGFCDELQDVILHMEKAGTCDVRAWASFPLRVERAQHYDIFAFFSGRWLEDYREEHMRYTVGVPVCEKVYAHLYNVLYAFVDMYSRHDKVHQREDLHFYINMFNVLLSFFHAVLVKEEIEAAIFSNIPHEGPDLILYELCKSLKIKTIIVNQHPYIGGLILYMYDVNDFGEFSYAFKRSVDKRVLIDKGITRNFFYMAQKNTELNTLNIIRRGMSFHPISLIKHASFVVRKLMRVRCYQKNLRRYSCEADYTKKYCYFALHFQPEMTTSALGGIYNDQLLALQKLSELLPEDWLIFVKEHPMQTEFMRSDIFFKRLATIPKVVLVHKETSTYDLIENSEFVSTITGTVAWEAICSEKKALVFGRIWYKKLPGVFTYSENFDIDSMLKYKIDVSDVEESLNDKVLMMWPGVVDEGYKLITPEYSHHKNVLLVSELLQKMLLYVPSENSETSPCHGEYHV